MPASTHRTFRTIFLSDLHLGSRPSKAEYLIDFLRHHDAQTIYLVGDIVDGWRLRRSWHWPQAHNDVVQKLLRKARKGTKILYIAGNHDEFLRPFQGVHFGGIVVADRAIHEAANGQRFLVVHGDQFDAVVHNARWLAYLGDKAYDAAIVINRAVALCRRAMGRPYWSFSAWAKVKVKKAVKFISAFQNVLAQEALRAEVDGVICGHIHHAAMEEIKGVQYMNTGDWVESCTALVEDFEGNFEIVRWTEIAVGNEAGTRRRPRTPATEEVLEPA